MRRFDLFVRPNKNRRPAEEESLEQAAVPAMHPQYDADVYYQTGKKTIEAIMRNNPNGNYADEDAENFMMALQSLKIAAEKYQEELRWDDAELAWELIEEAAQDPSIKLDASTQKAYCHQQLISPSRPSH